MTEHILKGTVSIAVLSFMLANISHVDAHLYGGNRWSSTTVDLCYAMMHIV